MQLAFVLYKYFPFGGLQRDFMRQQTAVDAVDLVFDFFLVHGQRVSHRLSVPGPTGPMRELTVGPPSGPGK